MNVLEMFSLDSRVGLVTGGARTLGYDMAEALAEAGADVAVTSRTFANARKSADALAAATGRDVFPLELDVTNEAQVEAALARTLDHFGRIDVLVNNAGNVVSTPETAPFEKRSLKDWQAVVDVNMTGVFLCSKHAVAKAMMPARSGVIINIASAAGIIGKDRRVYRGTEMGGATLDYHAAKAGVINMTREMAVYLAPHNIRVNCISPGGFFRHQPEPFVKAFSETIPMGRMGEDRKELKGAAVFLASEASSYVTGHNLVVDGGLTIW